MISNIFKRKSYLFSFMLYFITDNLLAAVDPSNLIPFKPEHDAVNEAASNLPYIFLVMVLFVIIFYFLNKKTGLFKKLGVDDNNHNSVKVLQIKKITPNTVFLKVKIDDSEYMFLESKYSLHEIENN